MGGHRPDVDSRWPIPVQTLIKKCWQQRPKRRPAIKDVKVALDAILSEEPALQQTHVVDGVRKKGSRRITTSSVSFTG